MGVSPLVGGLRGSAICIGRPNGAIGSRGNIVTRGEKRLVPGVGGVSAKPIPEAWQKPRRGLLVIVSARGDMMASSCEYDGASSTVLSKGAVLVGGGGGALVGGSNKHGSAANRAWLENRGNVLFWKAKPPGGLKLKVEGGSTKPGGT